MTDPFDAAKRDLENRDRADALIADARAHLAQFGDWRNWPGESVIDELLDIMSWPDAIETLALIEWQDRRANGE